MIDDRDKPLHELNPTVRFSDRVRDYARYRPSYPSAAIEAILDGLTYPIAAADLGAGTGIASRLLADRRVQVTAIEPNAEMRTYAERNPRIDCQGSTAESTGLEDSSVDCVLCAQSFHWFHPQQTLREAARILKPQGRLCLMWNKRDERDPLTAGYRRAIIGVSGEHPAELRPFDPAVVSSGGKFTEPEYFEFPNRQRLTRSGLIGRAMSASYVPQEGAAHEALIQRLSTLFEQHVDAMGDVTLHYITQVYRATRR